MAVAREYSRMKRTSNTLFILAVSLQLLLTTACTSKTDRGKIDYNFNSEQGALFAEEGDYVEAEKRYKIALAAAEKGWGPDTENVGSCLSELGLIAYKQGDYKQAEAFYNRALQIRRKVGDPEKTANTLMFLAADLQKQDRVSEADAALEEALALRENKLGKDHLDVARTLEFIATSDWQQGKYKEGEPLLERALAIREKKQGRENNELLNPMNNLAAIYFRLKKYDKAEMLYKRMIPIQEKTLGKNHVSLSFTLESYGQLLREIGRAKEAEPLEQRAARVRARALGKETKARLDRFARSVTFHLLDEGYTSYERSQTSLMNNDLAPELVDQLKQQNLIPASPDKLASKVASLIASKQTTEVRILETYPLEPNRRGLVPMRVRGVLTFKSAQGSSPAKSRSFEIEYLIGLNKQTNEPMVTMLKGYPPAQPGQEISTTKPEVPPAQRDHPAPQMSSEPANPPAPKSAAPSVANPDTAARKLPETVSR